VNFVIKHDGTPNDHLQEQVDEAVAGCEGLRGIEGDRFSEEDGLVLFAKVLGGTSKKKKRSLT
jgi:hypothetical protein